MVEKNGTPVNVPDTENIEIGQFQFWVVSVWNVAQMSIWNLTILNLICGVGQYQQC